MITDLFTHLSYLLQKENIQFIYNLNESPIYSIILKPPSKICMIDIIPHKEEVLLIRYVYPFDKKEYIYAGIILENFSIALSQLLNVLFVDLKIVRQELPDIRYMVDSFEIPTAPDPQNYKYCYHGSFEINRK